MRREYPTVHGPGRRISIILLVLVAIALGADFGIKEIAETRLASSVETALDLPERPDIDLQGFPFLLQVARGRLDAVSVEVTDVDVEGLVLDSITLSFEDLEFESSALIRGSGSIASRGGTAQAVVTEDALSAYLQDQGTPVLVTLPGPGIRVETRVSTGGETTTATAQGPVTVEGGRLVFAPEDVQVEGTVGVPAAALAFDIPLPALIPGITYESVLVQDGIAAIEASLEGAELDVGG
ncbi:MAG: LmeA family phospholipid-binding protein [Actinomycetota bacterium]